MRDFSWFYFDDPKIHSPLNSVLYLHSLRPTNGLISHVSEISSVNCTGNLERQQFLWIRAGECTKRLFKSLLSITHYGDELRYLTRVIFVWMTSLNQIFDWLWEKQYSRESWGPTVVRTIYRIEELRVTSLIHSMFLIFYLKNWNIQP